jgi:hypothetical protein
MFLNRYFYYLKPFIPRSVQIALRRELVLRKRKSCSHVWPIDSKANQAPDGWTGWPDRKKFALVLTHDVDTAKGHENCLALMKLEKELEFRSSFNFVPEKYNVLPDLRGCLKSNGFEVGVHGLNHDGKLYDSQEVFLNRAERINEYLKEWNAVGFRSPAMHHNLNWIHDLNIEYDASTFDTDPFEPQPDGVRTIFPFWANSNSNRKGYVELPYTLPQDFTLFVLMKEDNVDIWKEKLNWIAENGGMALVNTHPDYMNFENRVCSIDEYPAKFYMEFLAFLKEKYHEQYWNALPHQVALFYKEFVLNRNLKKK